MTRYRTIVADPPWPSMHQRSTYHRGKPERYYPTMTVEDIMALPVSTWADDDAHLWLWGVNRLMEDAYRVVRAWGFTPMSLLTWCKPGPGMGYYLRSNTEHCILATIGTPPLPPAGRAPASLQQWVRASGGKSRSHSSKPAGFYDLVEAYTPGPYVDLFSRAPRLGWDHWGHGYEAAASGPPNTTMAR